MKRIQKNILNKYSESKSIDWINRNLVILIQFTELNSRTKNRDKFMANNVEWIYSKTPNNKLILWGHNSHISERTSNMGGYLNKFIGEDKYLSIGFLFYDGSYTALDTKSMKMTKVKSEIPYPGTYEYFFNELETNSFILNLKDLTELEKREYGNLFKKLDMRKVGATKLNRGEFKETNLIDSFDIIVFIKKSEPSILLN